MNCPSCGAALTPGAPFCKNCGTRVGAQPTQQFPAAASPMTPPPAQYAPPPVPVPAKSGMGCGWMAVLAIVIVLLFGGLAAGGWYLYDQKVKSDEAADDSDSKDAEDKDTEAEDSDKDDEADSEDDDSADDSEDPDTDGDGGTTPSDPGTGTLPPGHPEIGDGGELSVPAEARARSVVLMFLTALGGDDPITADSYVTQDFIDYYGTFDEESGDFTDFSVGTATPEADAWVVIADMNKDAQKWKWRFWVIEANGEMLIQDWEIAE